MSTELALAIGASLLLVAAIVCVPLVAARLELRRLRERYDFDDEEVEAYLRELPEVCHAVGQSLDAPRSAREIRRIGRESTVMAILRQRRRRALEGRAVAPGPGPVERQGRVTRQDLLRGRRRPPP